jgi:hypothetical protein
VSAAITVGALALAAAIAVRRARGPRQKDARSRRRGPLLVVTGLLALQALTGAPASAQGLDCKEPPNPERPGTGMVGAIDPAPMGTGQVGSPYDLTGYAGDVWHTYDLGCGPQGVTHPNAIVDTWVGGQLFDVGKDIVGATNGLHYALLSGNLMAPLDDVISTGTVALYDSVFTPWFGLVAVLLAVFLFRYIWQGDMAAIGKRTMWALAGLWFASATYLTPLVYTHALDDVVITGTSAVQGGFLKEVGVDERDALPTLLHDQVVYRNWLRGEFGSPDAPQAKQYGTELLTAQAWTKAEVADGKDGGSPEQKKQQFRDVANKMGSAYGYFQGVDGSRVGAGMLATVQSLAFASFQLLAKAAILLAQVLLRVLVLAGPVIGLVALLYHEALRGVGRLAGAAIINVAIISAMAGLHTLILTWLFDPAHQLPLLVQMLLAGLVTAVFLMIGRPFRRMGQMVQLSVGGEHGFFSGAVAGSVFSKFRGRGQNGEAGEDFWTKARWSDGDSTEHDAATGQRRRVRPEAEGISVSATAQRTDREQPQRAIDRTGGGQLARPALPGGGSGGTSSDVSGTGEARRPGSTGDAQLPEARSTSRVVDTAPVADVSWAGHDDDPVMVPSRSEAAPDPAEPPLLQRSDTEVVAGRPVNVVYRPSRGLEVAEGFDDRNRGVDRQD